MYLLDTNVYIDAFTDAGFGAELRRFHQAALPQIVLSAVVVHELLVGANDRHRVRALTKGLIEPFRMRRRVHVPSLSTWELAAEADRKLRGMRTWAGSLGQRAFANDLLIAASARQLGATLITRNLRDFRIIGKALPIRVEAPWPAPG